MGKSKSSKKRSPPARSQSSKSKSTGSQSSMSKSTGSPASKNVHVEKSTDLTKISVDSPSATNAQASITPIDSAIITTPCSDSKQASIPADVTIQAETTNNIVTPVTTSTVTPVKTSTIAPVQTASADDTSLTATPTETSGPIWCDHVKGTNPFLLDSGEACVEIPNSVIERNKKSWENFILGQFYSDPPPQGTLHAIVNGI